MSSNSPSVLYVINVDWFFLSHFLPFAREAQRRGWRCAIACEVTGAEAQLGQAGITVFPLALSRGARRLERFLRAARSLASLIAVQQPAIIHAIGLEAVAVTTLARMRCRKGQFIFAPTGLGFAQTQTSSPRSWALRRILPSALRRLGGSRAGWIFENEDDARTFGFGANGSARKLVVGGAGVDIERFVPGPLPPLPPLRVAMVSRMIHSKGPDIAVAAVGKLRNAGYSIELTLAGDADPFNPRPVPRQLLEQWKKTPGIHWIGRQSDIAALWADHHVACLPSRGGEGLPKSLLEAAACGRAIVTTDVPGCRDLVRDGVEGLLVPPGSVDALATALRRLLDQPELVARMGAASRERARAGYSERQVASAVMDFYARLTNAG